MANDIYPKHHSWRSMPSQLLKKVAQATPKGLLHLFVLSFRTEFEDSLFSRLFMLAEIDNFTAEEYEQYQKSLDNMGDYQNIINTAVEEAQARALAIGREEGLAEGRAEGRAELCRRMLNLGFPKDKVAEAADLSEAELDELLTSAK